MTDARMHEEDRLPAADLAAWQPPAPRPGLVDDVMARVRAADERRRRRRAQAMAASAGVVVAAAAAAMALWPRRDEPVPRTGAVAAPVDAWPTPAPTPAALAPAEPAPAPPPVLPAPPPPSRSSTPVDVSPQELADWGLPMADFQAAASEVQPLVKICVTDERNATGAAEGHADVFITLAGQAGGPTEIERVDVAGRFESDGPFARCLREAFQALSLPPLDRDGVLRVRYPVIWVRP